MQQLLLRGYVTPEDFEGSDTQRLQQALDAAVALDIRKVVLTNAYTLEQPLTLPGQLHLCIREGACLKGSLYTPIQPNYSFALQWLCIDGGGRLEGDIRLFNCAHVTVTNLTVAGTVLLEYCRWVRLEDCSLELLQLGKGCSECILQGLKAQVVIDTGLGCGAAVAGIDPTVRNVIFRDSECLTDAPVLTLQATDEAGIMNLLADGLKAKQTAVKIGPHADPRRYFDLTLTNLDAPWHVSARSPISQSLVK